MRPLETTRLLLRAIEPRDAEAFHRLMRSLSPGDADDDAWRQQYFAFCHTADDVFERLDQPPLCDRGVFLRDHHLLIGFVGFVPLLAPWGPRQVPPGRFTLEWGLYWALDRVERGKGYATEAARGMIEHAFGELNVTRIVATTHRSNAKSIAVMRRLGMRIVENPHAQPVWFQVAGILDAPAAEGA